MRMQHNLEQQIQARLVCSLVSHQTIVRIVILHRFMKSDLSFYAEVVKGNQDVRISDIILPRFMKLDVRFYAELD